MTHDPADDFPVAEPDINTTPLIDVLLVLLVMLIITIPMPPRGIDGALSPDGTSRETPRPAVNIDLDDDGGVRWNDEAVADLAALEARMRTLSGSPAAGDIHLRPAAAVPYGRTVAVLAAAHRQNLGNLTIEMRR